MATRKKCKCRHACRCDYDSVSHPAWIYIVNNPLDACIAGYCVWAVLMVALWSYLL
jgi:hypothetical protein